MSWDIRKPRRLFLRDFPQVRYDVLTSTHILCYFRSATYCFMVSVALEFRYITVYFCIVIYLYVGEGSRPATLAIV